MHKHIYMHVDVSENALLIVLIVISTIAAGLVPPIMAILTGRVFNLLASTEHSIQPEDLLEKITQRSMSIMALGAAALPVTWTCISTWMLLGEKQGISARRKLLQSYIKKPHEWYDKTDALSGKFTQINRCVEELRSSSAETSAMTARSLVTIVALICTSFYYSWSLTLITMSSAPIIALFAVSFSRIVQKYAELENEQTSIAAQLLNWSINSAQFVKLSCTEFKEIRKFRQSVKNCNHSFISMCKYTSVNSSVLRFFTLTMFVQAFWFGSTMVRKGKLSIGDVITCFHSCILLGSAINGSLHQIVVLQKGHVAVNQIQEFLNAGSSTDSSHVYTMAGSSIGDIVFDNVQFAYPRRPTEQALKGISLTFPVGKTTFIIGKSGSGKSTLANILLKFYRRYDGDVSIAGKDIRLLDQQWLIKNITLVEQRCTLFNDTLRNNILMGSQLINEIEEAQQLKKACRISLLEKLIYDLPDGLETKLGTGGVNLSGGQQQKLALARAFMRDSPILILDEALSAVDVIHRSLLMKAIRKWRYNKTTIILTHELNEINSEDFLYIIENGRCVEKGYQGALSIEPTSMLYRWMNLHYKEDNSDSFSQLTTVETPTYYKGFLDESVVDFEVETPRVVEDIERFPLDPDLLPITHSALSYRIRSKGDRVYIKQKECKENLNEEHLNKKGNKNELLPILFIIRRLFKESRMKRVLYLGIICSLFAGAANPIFSFTFSYLLNGIVPLSNGVGSGKYLMKWSLIVTAVAAVDSIFSFLKDFLLGYCSECWIMDLRNKVMHRVIFKEFKWFFEDNHTSSEISALVLNDLKDLRLLASGFLGAMSTFLIVSSVGIIWALITGWKLSLVCISMFPLMIVFSAIYGMVLQKYETEYKTGVADLENLLYEIVTKVRTIRCLQIESHFLKIYQKVEMSMVFVARRRLVATGFGLAVADALTMSIQAVLYWYALKLVLQGDYSTERMFKTFTLLLFTIMTCTNLINQIPDLSRGQRAASWIYRILDENEGTEKLDEHDARRRPVLKDERQPIPLICIKNLTFAYPSTPSVKIYKNLSLELSFGDTVAIVGESGSGKSTLISLLTQLYTPMLGSIFIDDTDVNNWNTYALRSQISVVEQKPTLFPGTIRENLEYGIEGIIEIEMYDMLKYVGIYDFISALPDGLETRIDHDLLSGGQGQKICIARALLRKPKILILDECTSALDPTSSHIISEIVRLGPPAMLTLCITHSEEMMRSCKEILILKSGKVGGRGSFDKLIEDNEEFFRLMNSDSN